MQCIAADRRNYLISRRVCFAREIIADEMTITDHLSANVAHALTMHLQAYCFWGQDSVFSPYYGAAFVSEFLGNDGAKIAMLDDGTSAIAAYAVFNASGLPVRVLVINTNYYDGTGTRSSATVTLSGLGSGQRTAKRMTAPSALSQSDEGAAVTIGGSPSFTASCARSGAQTTETASVIAGMMSVSVRSSEALIVFL